MTTRTTLERPGNSRLMTWIRDHLDHEGTDCLIWPFGRTRDGYGSITRDGKVQKVHRFICIAIHGVPPTPEHHAAHSCGNGHLGCANPRHLSWKTPSENFREGRRHPRRKLKREQADEIRQLRGTERPQVTAARFGVTECTIRKVQSGKLWGPNTRRERVFTDAEVWAIRRLQGWRAILAEAARIGADQTAVWRINKRRTYTFVPDESSTLQTAESP